MPPIEAALQGQQGDRLRDRRDDADAGRGVRAARVLDRAHRQAVRRVRADAGRRGAGVRLHRADAVADDVLAAAARTRTKHGRFYEVGERELRRARHAATARVLRARCRCSWRGGRLGACWCSAAASACSRCCRKELAPQEDQGFIIGIGIAPEGSTVEYTDKYAKQMEGMLLERCRTSSACSRSSASRTSRRPSASSMLQRLEGAQASAQASPAGRSRRAGWPRRCSSRIPGVMAFTDHAAAAGPAGLRPAGELRRAEHRHAGTSSTRTVQQLMAKMRGEPAA